MHNYPPLAVPIKATVADCMEVTTSEVNTEVLSTSKGREVIGISPPM